MEIKKGNLTYLTKDFQAFEFFSKSPDFLSSSHYFSDVLVLASQAIRDFLGYGVTVNSTLRTYLGNLNEGGAKASLHLKGEAIDLQTGRDTTFIQNDFETKGPLYKKLRELGVGGFGIGLNMVHLDTRLSGNQPDKNYGPYALWYYAGVKKNFDLNAEISDISDVDETAPNNQVNKIYWVIGFFFLLFVLKKRNKIMKK